MSPGRERRVPGESGKNLAMEIATQIKNIALVMLDPNYTYEKQHIKGDKLPICDYLDDIPDAMDYLTVKEGIYRPADMPKLTGLEP